MSKIMYNTYTDVESSLNNMKTALKDFDKIDTELNNIKFSNSEFNDIETALENAKKAVKSNVDSIKNNIESDVDIALKAKTVFIDFESEKDAFLNADFESLVSLESIKYQVIKNAAYRLPVVNVVEFLNGEATGEIVVNSETVNLESSINPTTSIVDDTSEPSNSTVDEQKQPELNSAPTSEASDSTYVVKQGDSLSTIAAFYGVSLTSLINANPQFENPSLILVGDKVNIPGIKENNEQKKDSISDDVDKNNNDSRMDDSDKSAKPNSTDNGTNSSTAINYRTNFVDGNRIVAGNSGYSVNEVMSKIKDVCEEQKIGEHWIDVCAISLWETGTYTSDPFINNNVGGMCHSDGVTTYSFSSLDEGITSYVSNLKNNYYDQGLTTIDSIASKYCPSNPTNWTDNVNTMKNQIENSL